MFEEAFPGLLILSLENATFEQEISILTEVEVVAQLLRDTWVGLEREAEIEGELEAKVVLEVEVEVGIDPVLRFAPTEIQVEKGKSMSFHFR